MIGTIIAAIILACKVKLGLAVAVLAAAKFMLIWSIVTTIVVISWSSFLISRGQRMSQAAGRDFDWPGSIPTKLAKLFRFGNFALWNVICIAVRCFPGIIGAWLLEVSVTIPTKGHPVWDKIKLIVALIFLVLSLIFPPLRIDLSKPFKRK